jgi:hypothetical protein
MKSKVHYDVILTKIAIQELAGESISYLLKEGSYFNCIKIDPNGPYFFMQVESENETLGKIITEINIPHHFVLYYISADSSIHPGL